MDSYNNIRERKNKNKDRKKTIFPCSQLPIILLKQTLLGHVFPTVP